MLKRKYVWMLGRNNFCYSLLNTFESIAFENNIFLFISGKVILNRIYLKNKPEIDAKILERLVEDLRKKKREEEEAR